MVENSCVQTRQSKGFSQELSSTPIISPTMCLERPLCAKTSARLRGFSSEHSSPRMGLRLQQGKKIIYIKLKIQLIPMVASVWKKSRCQKMKPDSSNSKKISLSLVGS